MKLLACAGNRSKCAMGLGCLILLSMVSGCGPGQGQLSGQVLYNGKPVPGGRVTFRPADSRQNSISAELDREGNYQAVLPGGEVQIGVDNRELQPVPAFSVGVPAGLPAAIRQKLSGAAPAAAPAKSAKSEATGPAGRYVEIPEKYYDIESSGLKYTVKSGAQVHNIELK